MVTASSTLPSWSFHRPVVMALLAALLVNAGIALWDTTILSGAHLTHDDKKTDIPHFNQTEVIDLSQSDYYSGTPIKIDTVWRKVRPPSITNYSLKIILPAAQRSYTLKFAEFKGHALIKIDGQLVKEIGEVDHRRQISIAGGKNIYLSFYAKQTTTKIEVQVTNYSGPIGGISGSLKIGNPDAITNLRTFASAIDAIVISIMLFMFFYHISIYVTEGRDVSNLWFSIFSLLILIRATLVGEANFLDELLHLGATWSWRLELITYYFSLPILTEFINSLFPNETKRQYTTITLGIVLPFAIFTLFTQPKVFNYAKIFVQTIQIILSTIYFFNISKAISNGRSGAKHFLIGYIFLASFSLLEVIALYQGWGIPRLSNFGFLGFAALQSIILAKRQTDAFFAAEASEQNVRRLHGELRLQEQIRLDLTRIQVEKSILKSSLAQAQAFSNSIGDSSAVIPELEIASVVRSAEVAGGDWLSVEYDPISHRAYVAIADVTGHDMLSALVTITAIGTFRGAVTALRMAPAIDDPKTVLSRIVRTMNEAVRKAGKKSERLMSMVMIMIDFNTGAVFYFNAGHTPLIMINKDGVKAVPQPSAPLGLTEEIEPKFSVHNLKAGDGIFLYTDGLLENSGPTGERLKIRALRKILAEARSPVDSDRSIRESCEKIWQNQERKDDTSYIHLRWVPSDRFCASNAS